MSKTAMFLLPVCLDMAFPVAHHSDVTLRLSVILQITDYIRVSLCVTQETVEHNTGRGWIQHLRICFTLQKFFLHLQKNGN